MDERGPDRGQPPAHGVVPSYNARLAVYGFVVGPACVGVAYGLARLLNNVTLLTILISAALIALAGQRADAVLERLTRRG